MKYPYGTVLKFTAKAMKRHPNHLMPNDRMIVVDKDTCIWYCKIEMENPYKQIVIPANTIIQFDLYRVFDSFVVRANEEIPQLSFSKECYSGGIMSKELLNKYKEDFNIAGI